MAVHDHTVRTCSAEGCGRPHDSHGYCSLHSRRLKRHGSLTNPVRTPKPFEKCSVDGCDSKVHAHGMCGKHAQRMARYGRTDFVKKSPTLPYFETCFEKHESGCWLMTTGAVDTGYAHFCGKLAHRVSYRFYKGEIPKGMVVMHSCDVRHCVNPAHLHLGTHKMNTDDMIAKGRQRAPSRKFGVENNLCKFTAEDVAEIRRLYKSGLTMREIASRYRVHHGTVSKYIRNDRVLPMTSAEAANSDVHSLTG
jgi:hypothetical protein